MEKSLKPHEAFRIQALIKDTLKKLNFLGKVMQMSKSAERDDTTEIMGDEISRIISEQRQLEEKYAELVKTRSSLTGISNKQKFEEIKSQIKEVANSLRENTKNLCRVLKDNPNVQDNLIKIEKDRQQLYQGLFGLKTDLLTLNYHTFAYNITEQLQFQDLLHKKRQLEKETSLNVKTLAEDYKKEYQEYITETKEAQQEILRLREEVAQQKIIQSLKSKYTEKELEAGFASEKRNRIGRETELLNDISELEKAIETEKMVNKRIENFMTSGREKILKDNDEWKQKTEKDRKELLTKIDNVSKKKEAAKLKLEGFTSEQDSEKKRNQEREKDEKEREARLKQEREDNERKTLACEMIAREYLKYKELTVKTKGKKGKKKGKK
jgi:ribosomal protein L30/L7E